MGMEWEREGKSSVKWGAGWSDTALCWHLFWLPWPCGHPQPCLSLPGSPGLPPPPHSPGPHLSPPGPQPLPQRCGSRAGLQLPMAGQGPAPGPPTGPPPGLARPSPRPRGAVPFAGEEPYARAGAAPVPPADSSWRERVGCQALCWQSPMGTPRHSQHPREPWRWWTPPFPRTHTWINLPLILCKISVPSHADITSWQMNGKIISWPFVSATWSYKQSYYLKTKKNPNKTHKKKNQCNFLFFLIRGEKASASSTASFAPCKAPQPLPPSSSSRGIN